jgi:hypothetical protein
MGAALPQAAGSSDLDRVGVHPEGARGRRFAAPACKQQGKNRLSFGNCPKNVLPIGSMKPDKNKA